MNIQDIKAHRKLLAMILGVTVIATVGGSMAHAQIAPDSGTTQTPQISGSVNLSQLLLSSIKTSFTTAADTAASQVTGGQVLSGSLVVKQDYAVYAFKVTDGKTVYSVIVESGNGSVLYKSQGHPLTASSIFGGMNSMDGGHRGMMMHGPMMGGHMGMWQKPQNSTAPSGTTPSGFQE
ncbi:MAG: hypothetical protein KGH88_09350 [Thaumarchaeota archaeon]|nr:hypothetical protein [Nitrososphaerota archaeon]